MTIGELLDSKSSVTNVTALIHLQNLYVTDHIYVDNMEVDFTNEVFNADLSVLSFSSDIIIEAFEADITEDIFSVDITMEAYNGS